MINTIDELRAAFDNTSGEKLINNNYINSQNVCQYCTGDESKLLYDKMNNKDVMFDYETYSGRVRNSQNMKFGKCRFKDLFGERIWESFSCYRESAFGIDAVICGIPEDISVALVEHLIWYPERNSVRPVIVTYSKFRFWDMTHAKAWMYPQLAHYTHLIIDSVAKRNQMKAEYPLIVNIDIHNDFAVYDMSEYLQLNTTGDVIRAISHIRRVIKENISIKKNVKEGSVCVFK